MCVHLSVWYVWVCLCLGECVCACVCVFVAVCVLCMYVNMGAHVFVHTVMCIMNVCWRVGGSMYMFVCVCRLGYGCVHVCVYAILLWSPQFQLSL